MTRLDDIELALHIQGHGWRIRHRDEFDTLVALIAVARAALRVSNETALSAHKRPTFRASHELVAALTPLMTERGAGSARDAL